MGWCDGGAAALVSPGGGRSECGPAGAGTPAGVAEGLVDALTEHYSSPGRLADCRRRFERASREPRSDPLVFAVELETLAMWAFGDLSPLVRRGEGEGGRAPADETAVCCARLDDFDWVVPDRFPDMLVSGCATEECLSDLRHDDDILPDVFLVISTGTTAVPVSLPIVDEMVSSAVFVEGAAPVVVSLAEEEVFIVGMVGLIEAGGELPVDLLDSERVSQDCCVVDVGMVVPEQSPVVSVVAAAVPMPFPAFDKVFPPAVFAGGRVVADAAPLAVVGTVTVGVSVLVDAGSELPAGSAGAVAVRAAPLAEAGEDTLDVVGLDVGELLFWTDSDDSLPMTVAESGAMSKFVRLDAGPVVMLNMLVDVLGDDRFSPGVSCCDILDRLSCIVPPRTEHWEHLEFDWDSSVDCITGGVGALDHPVGKLLLDGVLIAHPSDILILFDKSDTIVDCGRSELYHPSVPHNRMQNMWRLSVFDSDSPDFPDTGDPDFCFGMPRLPNGIGNVESDYVTALLARRVGGAVPGL